VEEAYERGNGIEVFGGSSARESADNYEAWRNKTMSVERILQGSRKKDWMD